MGKALFGGSQKNCSRHTTHETRPGTCQPRRITIHIVSGSRHAIPDVTAIQCGIRFNAESVDFPRSTSDVRVRSADSLQPARVSRGTHGSAVPSSRSPPIATDRTAASSGRFPSKSSLPVLFRTIRLRYPVWDPFSFRHPVVPEIRAAPGQRLLRIHETRHSRAAERTDSGH